MFDCRRRSCCRLLLILLVLLAAASVPAFAASSTENRDDSILYLGFSPVRFHPYPHIPQSVSLGFYLGRSLLLDFEVGSYTPYRNKGYDTASDYENPGDLLKRSRMHDAEYTTSGVRLRWFPFNRSFFFTMGTYRQSWKGTGLVRMTDDAGDGINIEGHVETTAVTGNFGVGNMWVFDNGFTLGGTWGYFPVLGTSTSASVKLRNAGALSATERKAATRALEFLAEELNYDATESPILATLHLGWSF